MLSRAVVLEWMPRLPDGIRLTGYEFDQIASPISAVVVPSGAILPAY
jgi:hypothetical protein